MRIHARPVSSIWRRKTSATDNGDACSCQPCGPTSIQRIHGPDAASSPLMPACQRATPSAASSARRASVARSSLRLAKRRNSPASRSSPAASASSAGAKSGRSASAAWANLPGVSPAARRSLRISGTRSAPASGRSGTSRACVRAIASASRASSISCPAVVCSPKKSVAVSGSWWASSRTTVLHAGSSSARPSSRNVTSAKNR